jgi:hemerythrin-like domain-containing protein
MEDAMIRAVRILRDEHRAIAAVVASLEQLARQARDGSVKPDFAVFRAMIYYIDAFPERQHHPKEDAHLFARLAARAPQARGILDELQREHAKGAEMIRELERAVLALEQDWPDGAREFADRVAAYAQFHHTHMRTEEQQVLPLAERELKEEDWRAIAAAFAENADPLSGEPLEPGFDALLARIVAIAPEPIGLGRRWEKRSS